MDLTADGSGLMPSDRDAERARVGCLIVDPHCCDPTNSLPQTRSIPDVREFLGFSGSPVDRVQTLRIENGRVEKGRAMGGRRGTPGFRVTRGWADPSSRTNFSVQLDNRSSPHGPDSGAFGYAIGW